MPIRPVMLTSLRQNSRTEISSYLLYEASSRPYHFITNTLRQTDGLSDNVFVDEIISICGLVKRSISSEAEQVQDISDRLIQYARVCMGKENRVSPFESEPFPWCFIIVWELSRLPLVASKRESAPNEHHRGGVRVSVSAFKGYSHLIYFIITENWRVSP